MASHQRPIPIKTNKTALCWLSDLAKGGVGQLSKIKAEECREYAAQCEQRAEFARRQGWQSLAEEYVRIAEQWRVMAEQTERYDLF